jgi:hypothetical protein
MKQPWLNLKYYPGICLEELRKTEKKTQNWRSLVEIWSRFLPKTKQIFYPRSMTWQLMGGTRTSDRPNVSHSTACQAPVPVASCRKAIEQQGCMSPRTCSLSARSASVSKTCLLYPGPLWQHTWTKRSILQIFLAYLRVGFEVLTAVVMKSSIFWDITPCSPLKVNRSFGGTCRFHLQGRKISLARNQRESRWQADPEDGGYMFLENVGWLSTDYKA